MQASEGSGRLPRAVLTLGLSALALKLFLAATTRGTNDIEFYAVFLREALGSGAALVYRNEAEFNHPPFVIHLLLGLRWIVNATGLPFGFCLRVLSILADLGSLLLVSRILAPRLAGGSARATLLLMAAAPVSIMVSGFHGNTDPVMVFLVLLSVSWLARGAPIWLAGAAMGMAVNIKVVPLVFWPAVFLWLPGARKRVAYFAAAIAVAAAGSAPVIFQEPALVARKVFGYPSAYGQWGISRVLTSTDALAPASALFEIWGRLVLIASLVVLSVWMNRAAEKPPLFRQLGVIAFAFLTLTPGFGVQYLAWLVPWVVGLPARPVALHVLATAVFLFLVYTFWCQDVSLVAGDPNCLGSAFWARGFPWDSASALRVGPWRGSLVAFEVASWASVVGILVLQLRALRAEARPDDPAAR